MTNRLSKLGDALTRFTEGDDFLTLSEGYFKVCCIKVALSMQWVVQEGAQNQHNPRGGRTSRADYLKMLNGRLHCERRERTVSIEQGSTDIVIVEPFQAMLELKTKPDIGTKSLAQFAEIYSDVERVAANPKCAFLFVFDEGLYRSFSNEKTDNRGRNPAQSSAWFHSHFQKLGTLTTGTRCEHEAELGGVNIRIYFWTQTISAGQKRVICAGGRPDGPWLQ